MKKLSEIGREFFLECKSYFDEKDHSYSFARVFYPMNGEVPASVIEGVAPVHVYTPEERREFSRGIIEAWNKEMFGERNASIPSVEDFIKREGL